MTFWEFFHKKLNSSFFLNGACPSSLAVAGFVSAATSETKNPTELMAHSSINMIQHSRLLPLHSKTVPEYLEQATQIPFGKLDNNTNSFTIFLMLLAEVLDRFQQTDSKNQIMKIKGKVDRDAAFHDALIWSERTHYVSHASFVVGRILSKFGESKLFALNEVGIHNLLSLFLLISSSIGVQEIVCIV